MPHLSKILICFSIFGASLCSSGYAQAQTSDDCEATISEMGYPVESHVFVRGGLFSNDRHIYGDIVCEVSTRGEIRKIERDGQLLADDGIFGLGAILLREEAERISATRLGEARMVRDNTIEAAREIYEEIRREELSKYSELERVEKTMLENLIQGLRNGEINDVSAYHFAISPNFLAEFGEEEFFVTLRERREREIEAEEARIQERARQREHDRVQRQEQRQREQAIRDERAAAQSRQREQVLGVPVEPDAFISPSNSFPEAELLQVGRIGIQMIHARGWACDSVSAVQPFFSGGGIRIRCNRFNYEYELTDRGGRWHLELK